MRQNESLREAMNNRKMALIESQEHIDRIRVFLRRFIQRRK